MKIIDSMPIIIIVAALLANIAIGVANRIEFYVLMIRCIVVTIVFGILSYMLTKTIKNALEYSRLSKLATEKDKEAGLEENQKKSQNKLSFDIKVPPLDDVELLSINNDSDDDFVELNPVRMRGYNKGEQE